MKKKLAEIQEQLRTKMAEAKAALEAGGDENVTKADALVAECEKLRGEIERLEKAIKLEEYTQTIVRTAPVPSEANIPQTAGRGDTKLAINYKALPRTRPVTNFKGEDAEKKAYGFASFFLASALGHVANPAVEKAKRWCRENGVLIQLAQSEGVNADGGWLVPPEYSADIIDLREQYGVFRPNVKIASMGRDAMYVPRRVSGVTAYWVGEGDTITDSQKAWNQVGLVAKKLAAIAIYSSELSEDAMIDLGNDLAGEIAYAFALSEDKAGFIGDGSPTYGNCVGAFYKLENLDATPANIAGLVTAAATHTTWAKLTIGDMTSLVARLPQYADAGAKFYCHRAFYYNVMRNIALTAGGVTAAEVATGAPLSFMGYPVVISQVLPSSDTSAGDVACMFGRLDLAATLGDRRELTISLSDQYKWAQDQIAIKGTERVDINVHDVGNADATAANRVPGPVVGLAVAAA